MYYVKVFSRMGGRFDPESTLVDKVIVDGDKVRIEGAISPIERMGASPSKSVIIASHSSPSELQIRIDSDRLMAKRIAEKARQD